VRILDIPGAGWQGILSSKAARVRIADFSMAVTVVDHVVAHPLQVWGFMEALSEVKGCSAGGVK
jgi:hypothetical protein